MTLKRTDQGCVFTFAESFCIQANVYIECADVGHLLVGQ
ncbi:hypothetical protein D554_2115 [Bordetella holmesii 30539]|uniref:N-acetyltransferase YedL n=1 Tax=Bordetella holmesii 1058 TaxID=1247648 RepID=A0ABN0S0R1_9BORD|nr:hypothetical protein D557_3841 [Bordetella holmesii 70147]EXF86862.1 hypothetical protein D554_2115 [Bordetella holmesii 30539]EXX95113.1 hypothetical protein D559_2540 [Bordetella holmesii 1058]